MPSSPKKHFALYLVVPVVALGTLLLPMPWSGGGTRELARAEKDVGESLDVGIQATEACAAAGAGVYSLACGAAAALLCYVGIFCSTPSIEELYNKKEYKDDVTARNRAANAYKDLRDDILKVISTGGKGDPFNPDGPTWVENWRVFVTKVQKDARANLFPAMIYDAAIGENATICKHFAEDLADIFDAKDMTETYKPEFGGANRFLHIDSDYQFDTRVRCTLPEDFDMEAYLRGDEFSWDIYYQMLEWQNNPVGVWLASMDERQRQIAANERYAREELLANGGNRGIRNEHGNIITPGSMLNQVGATALTSDLFWFIEADEVGEVHEEVRAHTIERLENLANKDVAPTVILPGEAEPPPANKLTPDALQAVYAATSLKMTSDKLDVITAKLIEIEKLMPAPTP